MKIYVNEIIHRSELMIKGFEELAESHYSYWPVTTFQGYLFNFALSTS